MEKTNKEKLKYFGKLSIIALCIHLVTLVSLATLLAVAFAIFHQASGLGKGSADIEAAQNFICIIRDSALSAASQLEPCTFAELIRYTIRDFIFTWLVFFMLLIQSGAIIPTMLLSVYGLHKIKHVSPQQKILVLSIVLAIAVLGLLFVIT